ncbi:MFS transporter [[Mycobacterium] wendilense]|uniref:MFS transporter n=1 Tax=[Mycobacterium] wendilense TaxID=3064284 RepID=A0ABN9P7W9_9MYCO|nr:MFS transporter [Mycolicibacterium sp. MU0050]CAJ1584444.1 MFS transporter [Mycolicibacterium sp. MU0050]
MSDAGAAENAVGAAAGAPAERRTPWVAIVALALGIFVMITIEQLPIGVLTLIGGDLGVSSGMVGLAVTIPGILAGAVAVFTPTLIGRLDRRLALVLALLLVFLSAVTSAIAPNLVALLAFRLFAGVSIGIFWALLAVVTARVAHPADLAKALTVAYGGVSMAIVIGVPFAAWIGAMLGWRWAFVLVGALGLMVAGALFVLLPPVTVQERSSLRQLGAVWSISTVRLGVMLTLVLVTFHFTAYTYASPVLQDRIHITIDGVGPMLFVFGIAGFIGNFVAGPLLRRSPRGTFVALPIGVLVGVLVLGLLAGGVADGAAAMALWGLFGGAISVVTQAWILHTASDLSEPATALNSGAFNIAIAFGALVGGRAYDGGGALAVTVSAAAGLALAAVLAGWAAVRDRKSSVGA